MIIIELRTSALCVNCAWSVQSDTFKQIMKCFFRRSYSLLL